MNETRKLDSTFAEFFGAQTTGCSRQAAANYRLAACAPQSEPFTIRLFLSFRADHGSIAFALAFFGWREVVRRFFAFAVSNSTLPSCRAHCSGICAPADR